ncbi:MAG: hypothetical protein HN350_11940 [Phycisphaerales bacterium]|jgi:type II secretory pathway pseudopilin PulG|nr:hypothetical protein [Phycisphaerales bacterium]
MLELIIVVGLLGTILAVVVVSGTSAGDRRKFQYAVDNFETMLRMARAEAANQAVKIRISFDAETGLPKLEWEPQPLTNPQQFEAYTNCSWRSRIPTDRITVVKCRTIGPDGRAVDTAPTSVGDDSDEQEIETITFNQDGSSDSVLIEIESTDLERKLRAAIKLDGENSLITSKILYRPSEDDPDPDDPFVDEDDEDAEDAE